MLTSIGLLALVDYVININFLSRQKQFPFENFHQHELKEHIKISNLLIFGRMQYLKSSNCIGPPKIRRICMGKITRASQSLQWFSIQILVNFEYFQTVVKCFLKHYRAQISFLFIEGNLSPSMHKGKILWRFKNLKFTRFCMDIYPLKRLGGNSCFCYTNPSNFWRPLQLLLLRYKTENLEVT